MMSEVRNAAALAIANHLKIGLEDVHKVHGLAHTLFESEELFCQRNPRFAEGSLPALDSGIGEIVDSYIKLAFLPDPKTRYKLAMDGFGQHAGGLIILNKDNDHAHLLAVKGDLYNKGKVGVLGGQGRDIDRGDALQMALRECGEEIGAFQFHPERLFELITTREYRTVDSRGDYAIWAVFFIYLATGEEVEAMKVNFRKHVAATGGDPEIHSLTEVPRRQVLEMIQSGRMGYYDQTRAFTMTALTLARMQEFCAGWKGSHLTDAQMWAMAKGLALPDYERITSVQPDWRLALDLADFGF